MTRARAVAVNVAALLALSGCGWEREPRVPGGNGNGPLSPDSSWFTVAVLLTVVLVPMVRRRTSIGSRAARSWRQGETTMRRIITALAVAVAVTASLLVGSPAQASTYTRTGNCSWLPLVGKTITVTYESSGGFRRPLSVKFAGGTIKVKAITADWVYNNGTLINRETAGYGTGVTSATVAFSPSSWLNPAYNNYVAVKLTAGGGVIATCRVNVGD